MDDRNFFILALENINESIKGERYSIATEKIGYLIDILKEQEKENNKGG